MAGSLSLTDTLCDCFSSVVLAGALVGWQVRVTERVQDEASVPMFRGNPARTGEMPGPGPEITLKWQIATRDAVYSPPPVVDGGVYVGSDDSNVCALWTRPLELGAGGEARLASDTTLRGGPAPTTVERAVLSAGTLVARTGEALTAGDGRWWPIRVLDAGEVGCVDGADLEPTVNAAPE